MKIASWNVNSIKARKEHVKRWLDKNQPDILMIQELKGLEFPTEEFEPLGYKTEAVTQKAYNGVAVFSKHGFDVIHTALPGDDTDEQARYIEIEMNGIRIINIYLPNGNPVSTDGEKFPYKIKNGCIFKRDINRISGEFCVHNFDDRHPKQNGHRGY